MMRILLCLLALGAAGQAAESIQSYTLTNKHGVVAKVTNYGAIWTHMLVPDRNGKLDDVLLGFDTPAGFQGDHPYFGATIGRVGNRIAKGRFELNGKTYQLACNNGPNHLHGGLKGFDKVVWHAEQTSPQSVTLTYTDPDGNNGYPGTVEARVTYTLTDADELKIDYWARSDQDTPLNLTNHAYFNLGSAPTILDHVVQLFAHHYTPIDDTYIPTGEIARVEGTDFDFTAPRAIGHAGYDHNFVVDGEGMKPIARVVEPTSGRVLEIFSDQPGVQFYVGNYLDGSITGKKNYVKNGGFCLETQHYPDSPNHPNFPSIILKKGQEYRTSTVHRFSVSK